MNIAILVASENYAHPDEKLTSPSKDIELLKSSLDEYCKYDSCTLLLIEDGKPQTETKQKIKDVFSSFSGTDIENLLFYFSGHGSYEAGNDSLLCLNDNERLGIKEVAEWINNISPKSSYIIVDACQAGSGITDKYDGFANNDSQGFFGIFASTPTTYAYTNPHISFFTKTFCDALDDYSNYTNNNLSVAKIYEYIHNIFKTRRILQRISIQQVQKDVQAFAHWKKPIPYCSAPIIDPCYIERSDETFLINNLLNKRTLLLCGDTKVGKTYLALSLARKLWKQGYDFIQTDDLDKARSFLSLTDHPRICLLDDPYGAWKTLSDSDRHKAVSDIIINKPATNLLIITSRKDIVLEIFGNNDLKKCKEGTLIWQEVYSEKEVLLEFWYNYAYSIDLSENTINTYIKYLSSPENVLTVGNLKAISAMPKDDIEQKSQRDIVHLSQIEAFEQAGKYLNNNPEIWNICSILALTCSTIDSVTYNDIRFILYNEFDYPSIEVRRDSNIGISGLSNKPRIPEYKNLLEIEKQINSNILWLEQQNVIKIIGDKITFTHPYHQEVCIYMLSNLNARRINILIRYLYNSLNCLNPNAAFICSKNIRHINSSEDQLCRAFVDIPMAYFHKPIYPKVRDSVLQYLTDEEISMSPQEIEEFAEMIADASPLYIYWNRESPFYEDFSLIHDLGLEQLMPDEYIQGIEIVNRKAFLSPKFLNQLLLHHIKNKVCFEQNLFEKTIRAEEGFLRSAAIKYLFDYLNEIEDKLFIHLLTGHKHFLLPDSAYDVVELCFNNFHKVNAQLKTAFKEFISNIFRHSNYCLRCSRFMLHFSCDHDGRRLYWRDYNDEQQLELWQLWKDVFPIFLSNMHPKPASYLMSGRYSSMLMDFAEKVTPEEYITIFESILQFYKLQIDSGFIRHTDQLTAISLAIEVTKNSPEARKKILTDIFDLNNDYATYHLISVCVVLWKYLRVDEKEIVNAWVSIDNKAAAIALFYHSCPVELLNCITKNNSLGFDNIEGVLSSLDSDLLNCCIDIFTEKDILTQYYWDCYEKSTFTSKCLIYLFSNEDKRMYEISTVLLYHNLMTVKLWFKVCESTSYINELAKSLSDLYDLGYNIKNYDKYWISLFLRFRTDDRENEFAEYFFYAYIRLLNKFPTSNKSLEKHFSKFVISYYNSTRYENILNNILKKVEEEDNNIFQSLS
jgi:hypothetical protein